MSPKDNESSVRPIESPSGLDLHPQPAKVVRVSRRAAGMVIGIVAALLLAYAYGGYRRTEKNEAIARQSGLPKAVAPATQAEAEIVDAVPLGNAALAKRNELQPPPAKGLVPANCGSDARTGAPYRFNPQTGQPCDGPPQERLVIRQAARPMPPKASEPQAQVTPEQQAAALAYQREQDAILSPIAVSTSRSLTSPAYASSRSDTANAPVADLSHLIGSTPSASIPTSDAGRTTAVADEYEAQNMQSGKEAFLTSPVNRESDSYLGSVRRPALSRYEIKAGWEIPAVLEQNLNSDLPGDLKALVTSNVYDTATGMYLLIPQGSRLIGKYDSRVAYGQDGVQVTWSRIIFPDASTLDLDSMAGLDSHGNAGLRDQVDRHYKRLIGFSVLTSIFTAAFAISQQRNESVLVNPNAGQLAAGAVGQDLSQTGTQITRRNLNVQPTIKVPAGYRFTVRVNRDILFEARYEPVSPTPTGR